MVIIIISTLVGLCIGSFLNVVVIRTTEVDREHCHGRRSECMSCGHTLGILDLIPVFSWLFLGGRCRYCKEKISAIYPIGESLIAVGFWCIGAQVNRLVSAVEYVWNKPQLTVEIIELIILAGTLLALGICSIQDVKEKMINVNILYAGIGLCWILRIPEQYILAEMNSSYYSLSKILWRAGMFVSLCVIFFALSKLLVGKVGEGDYPAALLLYSAAWFNGMFNALFIGSIIGVVTELVKRLAFKTMDKVREKQGLTKDDTERDVRIPMVPLMYLGLIINQFITMLNIPF